MFPGEANFLLCRLDAPGKDGEDLFRFCLARRLAIRRCANYPGLDARYVLFAVRCAEDNERLLLAVAEYLEAGRAAACGLGARRPSCSRARLQCREKRARGRALRLLLQEGFQPVPFKAQTCRSTPASPTRAWRWAGPR